jgi:hypothetical protein
MDTAMSSQNRARSRRGASPIHSRERATASEPAGAERAGEAARERRRRGDRGGEAPRIRSIDFEVFKNLFLSVAEEMGVTLCRTGFSPNIKERLDYSCAVYDAEGETIAQGDHMPVHLGAMPLSVRAAIESVPMQRGDMVMLNDPFRGGTHLPDITLVAPVFL